jgi:hypothetical protein
VALDLIRHWVGCWAISGRAPSGLSIDDVKCLFDTDKDLDRFDKPIRPVVLPFGLLPAWIGHLP